MKTQLFESESQSGGVLCTRLFSTSLKTSFQAILHGSGLGVGEEIRLPL